MRKEKKTRKFTEKRENKQEKLLKEKLNIRFKFNIL